MCTCSSSYRLSSFAPQGVACPGFSGSICDWVLTPGWLQHGSCPSWHFLVIIRGSQSMEFRVDSVINSDFNSGPLRSPVSSCSRFSFGSRIEITDSGVNSDVLILGRFWYQNRIDFRIASESTLNQQLWLPLFIGEQKLNHGSMQPISSHTAHQ
jgi:hypothetical protein